MKVVKSVPAILTSMPLSLTSSTSQVTTAPFLTSPGSAKGSPSSCLTPSEMRSFSTSTSSTTALTMSPFLKLSITCSPGCFQSRSDRCTMPSTSPSRPRNRPNSVLFLTSPSTVEPTGNFSTNTSQGLRMVCLRPSEMRRLTESTSSTCTSTSCEVGDMPQAVDAAEVDERTVVGDVLDDAVDHLALFEVLHQLLALLGAGLFENRAARHHDVAAAAIHLEDLERLGVVHQRCDVADRTEVDLRARQEGNGAVEVDGEAAFDLVEDDAVDLLVVLEGLLQLAPALFAARLVARQHGFAEGVFDAVEEHLDFVTDLEIAFAAGPGEFAQRHAAFGLQADVNDGHVLLDRNNDTLDDRAFLQIAAGKGLIKHRG